MGEKINSSIKSIRELKNFTQEYVAERLGMTQAGYSKIEKGITTLTFEKLEEIAVILEIDVTAIIHFKNEWHCEENSEKKSFAKNKDFAFLCKLRNLICEYMIIL